MKKALLAFAALATIATGVATKSYAANNGLLIQTQYYDDDGYRPPMPPRGGPRPGWDGPDRGPGRGPGWGDEAMRREIISPRRIARSLERRGYDVGDIRRDRGAYFVKATRPNGRRVIVVVDAFSGRILDERRAGRGW
ncbi:MULTISPECIES: antifreeze protein [Ochrobactrum]|uniref:Antifreeze protein n=1 Tax=Ochrobactrum chromiisoli TaxID=2993941 RepID=A0ABT3QTZ3_9HYPH|nr:antifreeze protein [Ochrobactrum chromiisoli]MCX2699099.1 antifreeze protein [Ochrobactrum chromiisoli]